MKFVAILGGNYKDLRFEPGEEVTGLPEKILKSFIRSGTIKQVGGPRPIVRENEEVGGGDDS